VKSRLTTILYLLAFSLLVLCAGYLILTAKQLNHLLNESIVLTAIFSFISLSAVLIFFRGQSREPQSQTMHTFVSFSLKFLLELVLAIIWFILAKKTTSESVLIFFVLYLAFSLFLIWIILKALKNKSL